MMLAFFAAVAALIGYGTIVYSAFHKNHRHGILLLLFPPAAIGYGIAYWRFLKEAVLMLVLGLLCALVLGYAAVVTLESESW